MNEGTLEEWKAWFAKERSPEMKVVDSFDTFPESDQIFLRLWTVSEGKPPKDAPIYGGKLWQNKARTNPSLKNVCIIKGPCPPLVLTTSQFGWLEDFKFPRNLPGIASSKPLTKPYLWRCRVCGEESEAEQPYVHCDRWVRQLGRVNKETKQWFHDFLEQTEWKFVEPWKLRVPSHGYFDDQAALETACAAGKELESYLNDLEAAAPERYELFSRETPHLRVSDLKQEKKIKQALQSAINLSKKDTPKRLKTKPSSSTIELGSVFDEFLDAAISNIRSEIWRGKRSVTYHIEDFDIDVRGTPDNFLGEIPVETKTVGMLPIKERTSPPPRWKNYLTQLAIYSRACDSTWMFLLLISRTNGEFSIVPFQSNKRMQEMQKEWKNLSKQKKFKKLLNDYKAIQDSPSSVEEEE